MKHNTWKQIEEFEGIEIGRYVVPGFKTNTVAYKTDAHSYTLVSPGESLVQAWKERHTEVTSLALVCNNSYHFMGIPAWLEAYPDAKVYATAGAAKRIRSKLGSLGITILEVESSPPPLPAGTELVIPPGHRGHDLWLLTSSTQGWLWTTCDSFLNYDRVSQKPVARTIQKIMGAAPGLKLSAVIKYGLLTDKPGFKAWVDSLLQSHPPCAILPSHGEFRNDSTVAQDLQSLFDERL